MRAQAGSGMLQHQIGFWDKTPHGQAGMDLIRDMKMRDIHPFFIQAFRIGNAFIHQGINTRRHEESRRQASEGWRAQG
jgi:hypothetical protein